MFTYKYVRSFLHWILQALEADALGRSFALGWTLRQGRRANQVHQTPNWARVNIGEPTNLGGFLVVSWLWSLLQHMLEHAWAPHF